MDNKLTQYLSYILGILLFCACHQKPSAIDYALELAGTNRLELEKLLKHYSQTPTDSLKLKAAVFLIENMPEHYSYEGDDILKYYAEINPVLDSLIDTKAKKDIIEKIAARYPNLKDKIIEDVKVITAEYLIQDIEIAFKQWQKPWACHLNFEEFCECLLPYKYEELQSFDAWRDTLSMKFDKALNDMSMNDELFGSTFHIARMINNEILQNVKVSSLYQLGAYSGYNFLSAQNIHKLPFGLCPEYVALGVLALRSHGIPIVSEYTPIWGRSDTGHSWYTILNDDGSWQPSLYDISSNFGEALFPTKDIPKIYRRTYARNPEVVEYMKNVKYIHPSIDLFSVDVTEKYRSVSNIEILLIKEDICDRYAYIATFNNFNWQVVDYGEVEKQIVTFKKIGRNLLYIALNFDGEKTNPASLPFIIHKNGRLEYVVPDTNSQQTIILRRKYPKTLHLADMQRRMLGGKIQGANKKDFSDSVTFYTISSLNYPDRIPLDSTRLCRYWRYLAPHGSFGNIAELDFWNEDGNEISGNIMGTTGDLKDNIAKVFDGDWLTCYDTWTQDVMLWAGLALKKAERVTHVRCVPRTDDNDIHVGDEYELMFWTDKGWKSLGRQTASDNFLVFTHVPENALLWLRDLSRGKQERLFTYKNGKQVWW